MKKLNLLFILSSLILSLPFPSYADRMSGPELEATRMLQKRIQAQKQKNEILNREFKVQKKIDLKQYRINTKYFLENIKTQPIYGIEILTAGSDASEAASMFGHAAIRLIVSNDPLEDIIVGPEAYIDDIELDLAKGIKGGYSLIPKVMTFMDFLIQYHRGEFRSVTRTIIPTTPQMRLKLIDGFLELNNSPIHFGKDGYKFMTNNCASIIMKLLGFSGVIPEEKITTEDINSLSLLSIIPVLTPYAAPLALAADTPAGIVHALKDYYGATTIPDSYIPAIDIFFKEMKDHGSYFLSKKPEKWKKKDFDNIKKLSTRALYMLYVGPLKLSKSLSDYVARILKTKELDLYDIYKMTSYDLTLYQICKNSNCAIKNFKTIKKYWDKPARMLTAATWGVAPNKRYDTKKHQIFASSQEYNLFMQSLFEIDVLAH